jgi:glycolate oxidase iron-sulfur subunit
LKALDFGVLAQCIHCGLCLPTCPTYDATKLEKHSPRGRIQLMRNVAEGRLGLTEAFGDEMYFCLGCLACETACPAGVDYTRMFEEARADIERAGILNTEKRNWMRSVMLRGVFTRQWLLRAIGRALRIYQASAMEWLVRKLGLLRLLPKSLRELEPLTPRVERAFSDALIAEVETPKAAARKRVGMLTGCVQDLTYSSMNRDTVDVLLANGCEVVTPRMQHCCGSHLKHYDHLLHNDPLYAARAAQWTAKVKDVHEFLSDIGPVKPKVPIENLTVTYHESCHLCHGQKITKQPRELLKMIPGLKLVELPESSWCCGSAGVYNITQPEMSAKLLDRKMANIAKTGAKCVANGNPGCSVQLEAGVRAAGSNLEIAHPITLLARAYRSGQGGKK